MANFKVDTQAAQSPGFISCSTVVATRCHDSLGVDGDVGISTVLNSSFIANRRNRIAVTSC